MTHREEIRITGQELIARIRALIAEGNVSKLRIRDAEGDVTLEMPVTIGAVTGGAVVLAAPWLALLGALAAFATDLRIEVERPRPDTPPGTTEGHCPDETGQEGDPPFEDHLPI